MAVVPSGEIGNWEYVGTSRPVFSECILSTPAPGPEMYFL